MSIAVLPSSRYTDYSKLMTNDKDSSYADFRRRVYENYRSTASQEPDFSSRARPQAPYLHFIARTFLPTNKDARILDLGCGDGSLLAVISEKGFTGAIGVDNSPEQVALASRSCPVQIVRADILEFLKAQAAGSFDVILAFDVIEHLRKYEALDALDDIARVLSPGGTLILHTPNAESPFFGRVRYGDVTHELAFTRGSLSQLLRTVGFSAVRCYEERPIVHGLKSAVRFLAWQVVRQFYKFLISVESGNVWRETIVSQNLLCIARK